jgi:hypothetical protein
MEQLLLVIGDGILPIAQKGERRQSMSSFTVCRVVICPFAHAHGRIVKIDSNHPSLQLAKARVYLLHREKKDR